MHHARETLRTAGCRLTPQRVAVWEAARRGGRHRAAEEITATSTPATAAPCCTRIRTPTDPTTSVTTARPPSTTTPGPPRTRRPTATRPIAGTRMNEARTTVRAACADDAGVLAALTTELGCPTGAERAARRLAALFESADDVVFVAVAPNGAVVDFVHAAARRLLVSDPFVEMEGLSVTAAAGLVAAVEAWTPAPRRPTDRQTPRTPAAHPRCTLIPHHPTRRPAGRGREHIHERPPGGSPATFRRSQPSNVQPLCR